MQLFGFDCCLLFLIITGYQGVDIQTYRQQTYWVKVAGSQKRADSHHNSDDCDSYLESIGIFSPIFYVNNVLYTYITYFFK